MRVVGNILTPEQDNWSKKAEREAFANAYAWLSMRFNNVREEEIGDVLARDIGVIISQDGECAKCVDTKSCTHSRAVLGVYQEYDSAGFREFVTRARQCDAVGTQKIEQKKLVNFDNSGIPKERRNDTFERFSAIGEARGKLLAAKGAAKECAEQNMGLIIGGSVGCGKTHLAIATGIDALKSGRNVRFYLLPELLELLRTERWNHESSLYEDVKRCDWLILDDAGTEKNNSNGTTNWKDELFFAVINYRYDHKLPVVITTNAVGKEGLQSALQGGNGERIFSRLMEMTVQVWLKDIPDYRRIKNKEER